MMTTTDIKTFQKMKQIIAVNTTLKLPTEKLIAQMIKASTGAFGKADKVNRKIWLKAGRPQILLKALSDDDLQDLILKAERRKLPVYRLEEDVDTATRSIACISIGPAADAQINQLIMVLDFYGWVRQNASNVRFLYEANPL